MVNESERAEESENYEPILLICGLIEIRDYRKESERRGIKRAIAILLSDTSDLE